MAMTAIVVPETAEWEPTEDSVICMMYAQASKSKGGIHIPDVAKGEVFYAHVVAVGPGKTVDIAEDGTPIRSPMHIKVGDDVVYARFHGERFIKGNTYYLVMPQEAILTKLTIPEDDKMGYFVPARHGEVDESFVLAPTAA